MDLKDIISDVINLDKLQEEKLPDLDWKLNMSIPDIYKNDIMAYTKLKNDILSNSKYERDAIELEKFRVFRKGFLREKGLFYSEGIQISSEYPYLKRSTFVSITNGAFTERYCLPICLPNGDVFTWMTYDPRSKDKYMIPKVIGREEYNIAKQSYLLGNLESLNKYDSDKIFFSEGMFDAYRAEEQYHAPSVAILGSMINEPKSRLLKEIKRYTKKKFIYIPDNDDTGLEDKLLNFNLWDTIFNFGKYYNTKAKDIDKYFRDKILSMKKDG